MMSAGGACGAPRRRMMSGKWNDEEDESTFYRVIRQHMRKSEPKGHGRRIDERTDPEDHDTNHRERSDRYQQGHDHPVKRRFWRLFPRDEFGDSE